MANFTQVYYFLVSAHIQCTQCRRYLRFGLYELETNRCNACVRKKKCVSSFAKRAQGYQSSVNHTFVIRRTLANEGDIDPAEYLRSIRAQVIETLQQGIALHTTIRWTLSLTVEFERALEGDGQQII